MTLYDCPPPVPDGINDWLVGAIFVFMMGMAIIGMMLDYKRKRSA